MMSPEPTRAFFEQLLFVRNVFKRRDYQVQQVDSEIIVTLADFSFHMDNLKHNCFQLVHQVIAAYVFQQKKNTTVLYRKILKFVSAFK